MTCRSSSLIASASLLLVATTTHSQDVHLSSQDEKLLLRILNEVAYDPPAEAKYVRLVRGTPWPFLRGYWEAWCVYGKDGRPERVYAADGGPLPMLPDDQVQELDLLALARTRFTRKKQENDPLAEDLERRSESPMFLAAWLYRRGEKHLAASALAAIESGRERTIQYLRESCADRWANEVVLAFSTHQDRLALAWGEWLLHRYPNVPDRNSTANCARQIVADLQRRKQMATLCRRPAEALPDTFDSWNETRKIAYLVEQLDDISGHKHWGHFHSNENPDPHLTALVKIGDAAVPALLHAMETDQRLSREVWFDRHFGVSRVASVRDHAESVVRAILRVRVFDPRGKNRSSTLKNESTGDRSKRIIRDYWNDFGHLPIENRLMAVLTDRQATPRAWRDAAYQLANLGGMPRVVDAIFWELYEWPAKEPTVHPMANRFRFPTSAEAMIAAMDRDPEAFKPAERYQFDGDVSTYLDSLVTLGDRRAGSALAARAAKATDLRLRRMLALAAHKLGDSTAIMALANDIQADRFALPLVAERTDDEVIWKPCFRELEEIIKALSIARLTETHRALSAMSDPRHSAFQLLKSDLDHMRLRRYQPTWIRHPAFLKFLRSQLDDDLPTGVTYFIADDWLVGNGNEVESRSTIPTFLVEPGVRKTQAHERNCDVAACLLSRIVAGLPAYHPLLNDADQRLKALKAFLDEPPWPLVLAPNAEAAALHRIWVPFFIPALKPLRRPATADDVRHGRAIYHLVGKVKVPRDPLPARAELKNGTDSPEPIIVVQAETDESGKTWYGVIAAHRIAKISSDEIINLRPLEETPELP